MAVKSGFSLSNSVDQIQLLQLAYKSDCGIVFSQVSANDLLHQVEVRGIQSTSLSGMYDGKELQPEDALELEPMEVNTYRVKFH